METKLEKAKEIIYEAVEYYLNGCNIDQSSIPENYEVTEGTALSFSDLIHKSGDSVENMLKKLYEGDDYDNDLTELVNYECKCYAQLLSQLCETNMGGEWDYSWDREAISPYSHTPGAWIVEKIYNK